VPDYRTTYTFDPASPTFVVLHELDSDQDGSFETSFESTAEREARSPWYEVGSGSGCGPTQIAAIEAAMDPMFTSGWQCLDAISPRLAFDFLRLLANTRFVILCSDLPNGCGFADLSFSAGYWGDGEVIIRVDPVTAFDGSCGTLEEVLFHEMLHFALGPHPHATTPGVPDPGDRVTGCARTCFGAGTSQTCAACLGSRNGDARCNHVPQVACTGSVPHYCPCSGRENIYSSATTCSVQCPSGLACFASSCRPLGPCR
jgi:hypothetical protein